MLVYAFYILKVIICSGILFGYYWLMLRNKIFHQYNRFYLLAAVILSLSLPLITIDIWHNADEPAAGAIRLLQAVNSSNEYLDEIVVSAKSNSFSSEQVVTAIYLLTSLLFLGAFIVALIKIRLLFTRHRHRLLGSIFFVNTTAKGTPFSFLKCIFWNDHIDPESTTGKQVFKHELAHVQQKHSYDKLLLNAVLVLAWCNPFFWLIRKELNMIHEFVADKIAVEDNDTEAFAAMILQAAYPQHRFQLSNPFFYSPIKRRLMMLAKNRNSKVGYIGRLMVLPLSVIIFAAFSFKTKAFKNNVAAYDGSAITVVIDAGHGGKDFGASSAKASISEKDMALAIAKKIKALNINKNLKIILTRETDVYQTPDEKLAIGLRNNADIFISLHLNPSATGLEVLVPRDNNLQKMQSDLLASALINEFKTGFQLPVAAQPQQPAQNVKVLQGGSFPAVLIEAGNITNSKDLSYLQEGGGQDIIARKILQAVKIYSTTRKSTNEQNVLMATAFEPGNRAMAKDTAPTVVVKSTDKALILVDGKVSTQVELNNISPEIITQVNVLKSPESIKLYGEKGKNGVILVETKNQVQVRNNLKLSIQTDSIKVENIELQNVKISNNSNDILLKQPLYVVNEVVLSKPLNLEAVQTNNIESINVIRDKIATAKYGPAAIHGVIEITTRDKKPLKEVTVNAEKFVTTSDEIVVVGYASKNNWNSVPDDRVFTETESEPRFPGGDSAWRKYLMKNLKANIPVEESWKAGVYKIVVSFMVRKDGTIADIRTNDYPGSKTAEHCIELIRQGPKWTPALQNDHPVNAYKKQPITFVVGDKTAL